MKVYEHTSIQRRTREHETHTPLPVLKKYTSARHSASNNKTRQTWKTKEQHQCNKIIQPKPTKSIHKPIKYDQNVESPSRTRPSIPLLNSASTNHYSHRRRWPGLKVPPITNPTYQGFAIHVKPPLKSRPPRLQINIPQLLYPHFVS